MESKVNKLDEALKTLRTEDLEDYLKNNDSKTIHKDITDLLLHERHKKDYIEYRKRELLDIAKRIYPAIISDYAGYNHTNNEKPLAEFTIKYAKTLLYEVENIQEL